MEKSMEIARSLEIKEIENLLYNFEADLTNALNFAGMKALKEIGKNPVIQSSIGDSAYINRYRIKTIIKDELNVYLSGHYLYNMFSNGRYSINVLLSNETPILSPNNISIEECVLRLERYSIPLIGPNSPMNDSTYLLASLPLTIEIRELQDDTWELLTTRTVYISSIITSRYPLLETLMNEYSQAINGTYSKLWTFTTVFANLLTLIRGFKHYRSGRPLNVMENRLLSVILNSGLLLQQSLVFGSIDPLSLVDLARTLKKTLKQTPSNALWTFNHEMKGDGYDFEPENLTKKSANADAGSPLNDSIDITASLNLTEIAERILYDISSVTYHFENGDEQTLDENIIFDEYAQERINAVIQHQANQSFFLTGVTKNLIQNATTLQRVNSIISEIYQVTLSTKVINRTVIVDQGGDPGEGWIDGGAASWNATLITPLGKRLIKPPKGLVTAGCALYEENYTVSYERNHSWWRYEDYLINGTMTQVVVWNNKTDILIETITLHSLLQHSASYLNTQDDVVDVLYSNETLHDPNLEDTLHTYLSTYNDTEAEKQQLIISRNNTGINGLEAVVQGSYPTWVVNESWAALKKIYDIIRGITLDPQINAKQYPNPFRLLEAAKNDFLAKYTQNISTFLEFSLYHPGSLFCSVGNKAVYYTREWYTALVKNTTETIFTQITQEMTNRIMNAIPPFGEFSAKNITETLDDASEALRSQFTIPFGYPMNLIRYDARGVPLWNETVRLAVDQYPNYLDPFELTSSDGEELWTLKIRNRCVFGPTGLPILPPTPITPWVLTLNVWIIDVQGEYQQFKIIDTSDETLFNPILGHEPQMYVRELKIISAGNVTLGENTRLSFGFTTAAFGIVPPWGMMLGDIQEHWEDDHTPGFEDG